MTGRAVMGLIVLALLYGSAESAAEPDGQALYGRCAACHLPDGTGVPGAFPPLGLQIQSFARNDAGRSYLVLVLMTGLTGKLHVEGRDYQGFMPAQSGLSDAEMAALLNHVVRVVAKGATNTKAFDDAEVAATRARYPKVDAAAVHRMRPEATSAISKPMPGVASPQRAQQNWMLNCRGCHGASGSTQAIATPGIAGSVARFLLVRGGREYLVRVPGVATAPLTDDVLAELINWMLWSYDASNVPADFRPYATSEVSALRRNPLRANVGTVRAALLAQ